MEWTRSTFITTHKKGKLTECDNYRTISLISHASKILLYVTNERLKTFLQSQISQEQAGFVPGRGTREQILNLRQIIEKGREFNITIYICFIDFRKAFDRVRRDKLWIVLHDIGVPPHLITVIKNLYIKTTGTVRANQIFSNEFHPQRGVRQGCILSPQLFNIYGEYIMRKALQSWEGGTAINGRKINNLRYADDAVLLARDA
jgi:hypothetical protein